MHCRLCPEVAAIEDIVDHVRVMHPDVELGPFAELDAATHQFVGEVRKPFVWIFDRLIRLPGFRP